ncbi:hypothetical protein KDL01_17745 [Actinospica durhamensis]|uniref:LPXTG cell wall anchor domain-containing protein n=1 Tax=Actinospica durhamensis TaxID=1508375 RepID=A0A941IRB7_9ACTN|nr:hypothetical protein [Actinospica durhamensis]MBR7835122.1 hypothetical protein [Actinospica durhamensis]
MNGKRTAIVLGGSALAALCTAGPALASGGGGSGGVNNSIIIQPNPVAPGGNISVFDGGNCDFPSTGTVTFQTNSVPGIPAITIGPLKSMIGGTGQVPKNIAPGSYQVTLICTSSIGKKQGPFYGTLVVANGASNGVNPSGGAKTGDGASLTTPGGLAEGAAMVATGGGVWFLLRRRVARSSS